MSLIVGEMGRIIGSNRIDPRGIRPLEELPNDSAAKYNHSLISNLEHDSRRNQKLGWEQGDICVINLVFRGIGFIIIL